MPVVRQRRVPKEIERVDRIQGIAAQEQLRANLHLPLGSYRTVSSQTFRSSGLTWMAIRGDSPVQIQHIGGHTNFKMTKRYLDAGGAVDLLPGESGFPELPDRLLESPVSAPPRRRLRRQYRSHFRAP